jgi:signal transduction histidine kinase
MDGLALLARLRELQAPVRAIIVSAYGDMPNIRTAMNRGAFDFVTKPIDMVDLEATIRKTLDDIAKLREIDRQRFAAERARSNLSQFLANMSHELRTPLNAIIGVTEMLREDAQDLKRDSELEPLDRVLGAGRHLLALINDILDLSKIEAGRMELHLESFSLEPLIDDCVKTIETLAAKNANRVVVHCDPAIETLHADQMRVRQALLNLVSNANKFTNDGTITINAAQHEEGGRDWIRPCRARSAEGRPL